MGYSCTKIASLTHQALLKILQETEQNPNNPTSSNMWMKKGVEYFDERGRENDDGAITGSVYQSNGSTCRFKGSYKINADGTIARFPTSSAKQRLQAEQEAVKRFNEYPQLVTFA